MAYAKVSGTRPLLAGWVGLSLIHRKALVDRRGRSVVAVARLRCLDRACAFGPQRHGRPGDRAHCGRLRIETDRQAGTGGRADRKRPGGECPIRECREGDRLTPFRHDKALADGRGRSVVGVARLRRLDRARAGGLQSYGIHGNRAHCRRLRSETNRQAGTGSCADRERPGADTRRVHGAGPHGELLERQYRRRGHRL